MDDLKTRFLQALPKGYFLENNTNEIEAYLKSKHVIDDDDHVLSCEKPGEGNMNFVLRVTTKIKSLIVKQSRPWVEKYPMIDAPMNRALIEADFYKNLSYNSYCPKLIFRDDDNSIIGLEDLGAAKDFTFLYNQSESLNKEEVAELTVILLSIHQSDTRGIGKNVDMRRLNHEHIFNFPFLVDNGFNLDNVTPGLQDLSLKFKTDTNLKNQINKLGDLYLGEEGKTLIHGDFYPGSWLSTNNGIKFIDPEFAFIGFREFDLGVMMAHLIMTTHNESILDQVIGEYILPIDKNLTFKFAGVEIMRRLIGIAQLPLNIDLIQKEILLEKAKSFILK